MTIKVERFNNEVHYNLYQNWQVKELAADISQIKKPYQSISIFLLHDRCIDEKAARALSTALTSLPPCVHEIQTLGLSKTLNGNDLINAKQNIKIIFTGLKDKHHLAKVGMHQGFLADYFSAKEIMEIVEPLPEKAKNNCLRELVEAPGDNFDTEKWFELLSIQPKDITSLNLTFVNLNNTQAGTGFTETQLMRIFTRLKDHQHLTTIQLNWNNLAKKFGKEKLINFVSILPEQAKKSCTEAIYAQYGVSMDKKQMLPPTKNIEAQKLTQRSNSKKTATAVPKPPTPPIPKAKATTMHTYDAQTRTVSPSSSTTTDTHQQKTLADKGDVLNTSNKKHPYFCLKIFGYSIIAASIYAFATTVNAKMLSNNR